jgi:uncharacterized protein with FMN-binding domain
VVEESLSAEEQEAAEEAAALRETLSATSSTAFAMPNTLKDGTYTGTSYGYKSYITVKVVVSGGKIASVSIVSEDDDEAYMLRARTLLSTIVSAQSPNVDVISGATYSSNGIINAVKQALAKAGASADVTATSGAESGSSSGGTTANRGSSSASDAVKDKLSKPIDFGSLVGGGTSTDAEGGESVSVDGTGESSKPIVVSVDGPYADGTYTASAYCEDIEDPDAWAPYYLTVEVEVTDGKPSITNVYGAATADDQEDELGEYETTNNSYIKKALNGKKNTGGIKEQYETTDTAFSQVDIVAVSGATYSSYAIREAYGKALYAAAKAQALADAAADGNVDAVVGDVSDVIEGSAGAGNIDESNGTDNANVSNDSNGADDASDAAEKQSAFQQLLASIRSNIKNLGKVN